MSGKARPVLLASVAALALTTAQAAPSAAQASPAAKAGAAKKGTMEDNSFTLVHGTNTLRATLLSAPPVYDPGGLVCFIEDWSGDMALLAEAEQTAAAKGAVLTRVICPHGDTARAAALTRHGYSVASEWYTAALPLRGILSTQDSIRPLTAADVPRVLELSEQKRREYQDYSPVFWRMSPLPRETFGSYMQSQIENPQVVALAHQHNGKIDGYVLANAQGYIDDYTVAAPNLWPKVGADLLRAAGDEAHKRGIKSLLVVCGAGDIPKRKMLAAQGFTMGTDWYVKPLARR